MNNIGNNKYDIVNAKYILLNAGLTYSFKLNGNSNKLQVCDTSPVGLTLNIFIKNKLTNDAINTPPKYIYPFTFWLNIDDDTRKNDNKIGDIKEKKCNKLLNVNWIAMR